MVKFSIIAAHYQGCNNKEVFDRFINSMLNQLHKDWECIIVHDGPLIEPIELKDDRFKIFYTKIRFNLWGHTSRELGLSKATGDYILHTNTDNTYEPNALSILNMAIVPDIKVYTFPIRMIGMETDGNKIFYSNPRDYTKSIVLRGDVVKMGTIDMMQLCAHKSIWDNIGWKLYCERADFYIFKHIAEYWDIKHININILGNHY
jgi:glycosyltransferase involved in cell wall biosynthesis